MLKSMLAVILVLVWGCGCASFNRFGGLCLGMDGCLISENGPQGQL
jgi:hypothetical protein